MNSNAYQSVTRSPLHIVDLKNPAFDSLAAAYDIPYYRIGQKDDLAPALSAALQLKVPALIEVES
jgi:thiamine pyrophosphate-dependent acetolactate synthase large subunit-like protein